MVVHALCVALVVSAPARNPAAPAPGAGDSTQKAKEAFQMAQRLYKEARYAEAIVKFEEANALKPSPILFYNIGKCHEQLGDVPRALRAYRDYLRLAPDAKDKDTVSDAIANLARRLKEKGLQQLMVFADPATAVIEIDGKVLGSSPASVELTAGPHNLVVKAEGYETTQRAFVMQTARATEMTINLRQSATKAEPPPPPPPPLVDAPKKDEPKQAEPPKLTPEDSVVASSGVGVTQPVEPAKKGRVWTWVAGGVAVASAGAGVGMGVVAQSTAAGIPTAEPGLARAQAQSAQGLATGANVAYGVAAGAAIAAVVLLFVEGK